MAKKTNENAIKAVTVATFIAMIIYIIIAFLSLYMFGSAISSNVLDNINAISGEWTSLLLRFVFLIVIGCHIPFIFFAGKDCFLNMYYELSRRAISLTLEDKLKHLK
jgi:amino acid permease